MPPRWLFISAATIALALVPGCGVTVAECRDACDRAFEACILSAPTGAVAEQCVDDRIRCVDGCPSVVQGS